MKNPFPGMNPYLEDHWADVHARLTIYIADQLQESLPDGLVARAEAQVAIDEAGQPGTLRPDVQVAESPALHEPVRAVAGTAGWDPVAGPAEPLVVLVEPERHHWVEILETGGRLVTVIEVLSPSNKSPDGRAGYRRRQRAYISGGVNLVEIDLLRSGERVLPLPPSEVAENARTEYLVCVFRASLPAQREIYPVRLRDRLPAIRIPLRLSDPDAVLQLQPVVDQAFERGRYWTLDYRGSPRPPLPPDDQLWAGALLARSGLRPPP